MVGKNNWEVQLKRGANKVKRYTIKRTSVGVVSAVVAAGLIFGQETSVQADEVTGVESQVTEVSNEELTKTEESTIVDEATPAETSAVEALVEEKIATEESTVEEVPTTEEVPAEQVYEQEEVVAEEATIEAETTESDDAVADSAVANQEDGSNEAIVETETAVADTKSVQEDAEVMEESLAKTEEAASLEPQMSTSAATANVVEADTEFPELISISTDKEVYQAGEDITVSLTISESTGLDWVSASFSRVGNTELGAYSLSGSAGSYELAQVEQINGVYKVDLVIKTDEKMPSNSYSLYSISLEDVAGNSKYLYEYSDSNELLNVKFDIINEEADVEFPELLEISTDKEVYQAGEDITVSLIVSENTGLDWVSASFSRVGNTELGAYSLSGSAGSYELAQVEQINGVYKVDLVIKTDEKMPSNSYSLYSISLEDVAGNSKYLYEYSDNSELLNISFSINVANIPYETIRELNMDLTPNSGEILVQAGVNGSADVTTGELINAPVSEIIHYAPVEVPFETVEVNSDDLYLGESVVIPGQVGLLDPETNEVVVAPVNEIIQIGSKLAPEEIPFETERVLDINLAPGSYDQLVQEGQVGLRDAETGEVISAPINRIFKYAPNVVGYETIRNFNPDHAADSLDIVIQYGAHGLVDPETNEVVVEPVSEIIEFGPVTIPYDIEYQIDDSLEPNSGVTIELQPGLYGLKNPDTGEVLVEPANLIFGEAPTESVDDYRVQNIITIVDQVTNQEIASTTFLGNEYSVRLNYFINQLNSQNNLELEVVDEKTTSDVLRSSTVNGFTVSSRTIKKNIYVVNNNNTDTTIEKPFLPEGVIYNNQDYVRAYRKVTIQDNGGRELYRVNYVAYESTDETIRNAMSNINSSDYYYDSVDVSEGFTSIVSSTGSYRGPLKEITILVNRIEEPKTPVEPEVPEVEESETPVEPEVPEVEEPEAPVEPEAPEVEEPETVVESEVPTNDVKAPVATSEDGVVVAEPIPTPAQTVATEGTKAESEVVVAETGSKVAETVLSAEVKAEETSTTVDDQVATLPAAGAQTMSALATGLGMVTTALGAVLVRKKK